MVSYSTNLNFLITVIKAGGNNHLWIMYIDVDPCQVAKCLPFTSGIFRLLAMEHVLVEKANPNSLQLVCIQAINQTELLATTPIELNPSQNINLLV